LANIKSSKKDIVRSRQNRLRNSSWKSRIKTEIRKSRTAITAQEAGAADLVKTASRLLDKAVTKGVIHKGQAARRKSRLVRRLAKVAAG
jgi:small subunit ribosomal protein S20